MFSPSDLSLPLPSCTETLREDITQGANGIALLVFYSASMVFIIVTNSLFINGLYRTHKKRLTSAQRLFFILSCSDLLAGFVYIPIQIYSIVRIPHISCTVTGTRTFWSVFPLVYSGMTIMFLTIDRYWIITREKTNKHGNGRLIVYTLVTFPVSFGWAIWYTLVTHSPPSESTFQKSAAFFISLATFELCVLAAVLIFNALILHSVRAKTKHSSLKATNKKTSEQRLLRTIFIISSILVICYLPSIFGLFVTGAFFKGLTLEDILVTKQDDILTHNKALIWSLIPTLINSGLNATVFIVRNTRIMRMYKSVYDRKAKWPTKDSVSDSEQPMEATPGQSLTHATPDRYRTFEKSADGSQSTNFFKGDIISPEVHR